jgi:hypothetical protein
MTGRNHRHPRTLGNMHSSTGTHPIAALHSDYTMRTRIIIMITLTSEKLPLIGAGPCMKGLIHQEPKPSTPMKVVSPRDLLPPGERSMARASLYNVAR